MKHTIIALAPAFVAAAALMVTACDSGGGKSGDSAGAKGSAAAMSDEKLDSAEIPVPEDFEEEAQKKVTEETYEDQLAAIEKEIEGDKE